MAVCNVFPVIDLLATGRSIEQRRKAAGLSVRDVQTYFGFEYPQAVYKWQRGECLPSVDNLLALSKLLRVPMEDLLVYEDREVQVIFGENEARYARKTKNIPPRPDESGMFFAVLFSAGERVQYRTGRLA